MPKVPRLPPGSPEEVVGSFFRENYPAIYRKVQLQVRRTPRRQTGPYKTNRESRWKLNPDHPDYTAPDQIPRIEAKLFASALEFDDAPQLSPEVAEAARTILGHEPTSGRYRCPTSGRSMNFQDMLGEAQNPTHGLSAFHVGHVRPKARGGVNEPDNTYWTTDLGNRMQGDKTLHETVKILVEMAEFQRRRENVSWGELVNRYLD